MAADPARGLNQVWLVANPACGQLNRKSGYSVSPRTTEHESAVNGSSSIRVPQDTTVTSGPGTHSLYYTYWLLLLVIVDTLIS